MGVYGGVDAPFPEKGSPSNPYCVFPNKLRVEYSACAQGYLRELILNENLPLPILDWEPRQAHRSLSSPPTPDVRPQHTDSNHQHALRIQLRKAIPHVLAILTPKTRVPCAPWRAKLERPQRRELQQAQLEFVHVVILQGQVPRFGIVYCAIPRVLERYPLQRRYGRVVEERADDAPDMVPQMPAYGGGWTLDDEGEVREACECTKVKGLVCVR